MPSNVEQLLISSVLRDTDLPVAMKWGLGVEHFHAYPDEWGWIGRYYQRHKKVPSKTAFREQFPEFTLKAVNDTGHYAEEVRKSHARYALTASMRDVADRIAAGDIDAAVKLMQSNIVQVAAGLGANENDSDILSSWQDTFDEVQRRHVRVKEFGMAGIPTGFSTLDDRTGGIQPGHVWIIGARLGQGKSWALTRMAVASVMRGYTAQYDSLEMPRSEVAMRVHSFLSSEVGQQLFCNLDLMQGRNFDLKEYRTFLRGLKDQVRGRLHVADTSRGRVSPLTIAAQIERNKPDIVFVDYLTLMEKTGEGDWKSVAKLSGEMKTLAMEYQIPVVAAAQLNRAMGLSREPAGPEALAQSDAIGQDADAVVTMRQDSASVITMKLAKYRHGVSGFKWSNHFEPGKGIFTEVSFDKAQDLMDADEDAVQK